MADYGDSELPGAPPPALQEKPKADYSFYPKDKQNVTLQASLTSTTPGEIPSDIFEKEFPWNEKFQIILEKPSSTPEEGVLRYNNIHVLSKALATAAKPFVKQIISELRLPNKEIPPAKDVGGIAGGLKYIKDGIFFKFATDLNCEDGALYGSDENAAKVAGHELKAMNVLLSTGIRQLHIPLSCIINYRGFRLLVNALLPINDKTLINGSRDACKTVYSNDFAQKLLEEVAAHLNLKKHEVEARNTGEKHIVYTAADVECHRGRDGRHYLLDLARLLPPEAPAPGPTLHYLYRLLRVEFVKNYPTSQLSSDAFIKFGNIEGVVNNDEILTATDYLFDKTFYILAEKLLEEYNAMARDNKYEYKEGRIKKVFHDNGVNLRFLGEILRIVSVPSKGGKEILSPAKVARTNSSTNYGTLEDGSSKFPLTRSHLDSLGHGNAKLVGDLAVEIGARVFRSLINQAMREDGGSDMQIKQLAADHVSWFVGNSSESVDFWGKPVIEGIQKKFISCMGRCPERKKALSAFLGDPSIEGLIKSQNENLLKRIQSLTGIIFSIDLMEKATKDPKYLSAEVPITPSDIQEVTVTEKHLQVFPFVEVVAEEGRYEEAEKYYKTELSNRTATLGENHPQVARLLTHMANMYTTYPGKDADAEMCWRRAILIMSTKGEDNMELAKTREQLACFYNSTYRFSNAESALQDVLQAKKTYLAPNDVQIAITHDSLAWAYHNQKRYAEAREHYDLALKVFGGKAADESPDLHARILNNMGLLLNELKQYDEAVTVTSKAFRLLEDTRGSWHSEVAIAHQNLGKIYTAQKNYPKAEEEYKLSMDIMIKALGENHSSVANLKRHLGSLFECQHEYNKAEAYYKGALEIYQKNKNMCLAAGLTLRLLAKIAARTNKEQAKAYVYDALAIFERVSGKEHEFYVKTSKEADKLEFDSNIINLVDGHIEVHRSGLKIKNWASDWRDVMRRTNDISRKDLSDSQFVCLILDACKKKALPGKAITKKASAKQLGSLTSPRPHSPAVARQRKTSKGSSSRSVATSYSSGNALGPTSPSGGSSSSSSSPLKSGSKPANGSPLVATSVPVPNGSSPSQATTTTTSSPASSPSPPVSSSSSPVSSPSSPVPDSTTSPRKNSTPPPRKNSRARKNSTGEKPTSPRKNSTGEKPSNLQSIVKAMRGFFLGKTSPRGERSAAATTTATTTPQPVQPSAAPDEHGGAFDNNNNNNINNNNANKDKDKELYNNVEEAVATLLEEDGPNAEDGSSGSDDSEDEGGIIDAEGGIIDISLWPEEAKDELARKLANLAGLTQEEPSVFGDWDA